MKSFNLSDWALEHRALVWYFMIAFMAAGIFSYLHLGRQEDPDFTIKTMVIQAQWPGASAEEITREVTDRIEKKLEELESLDYTKSVTVPGQTTVFVYLRDSTKASDVKPTWVRVRNLIADIKGEFPQGVIGPGFNDTFGDVYGNIYAFTGDGLSHRQLRDYVEDIREKVLTVPNAGKVDILGAQDEVIFLEFSTRKVAALGLDNRSIMASLQAQNAVTPSGVFQKGPERIMVRVNGAFASEATVKAINLRVNDRFFPLTDVATITRGYADPPKTLVRFNGQPAIALAIGMKSGANLLQFGEALKEEMSKIVADLPIGVGVHLVADQPVVVEHAVSGFTEALFQAVAIVLGISFLSLGLRAGLVVAIAIPLVLAITFVVMAYAGISLQRISLGALIIVKVDVLQDKARQLGVSSEDIATTLNSVLDGTSITQVRDSIYLVNVVGRATARERASIDTVRDMQLIGLGGRAVPLGAVATIHYEIEQPTIWRRARLPTVTLKASTLDDVQPKTIVDQLAPQVAEFAKRLPAGYSVAIGGAVEESTKSQNPIIAVVPLMLFMMATILMVQLQSFHKLFLVFAVAPLAVIGVVLALLPSGAPLGFVAILGVLALIGILVRNSVILIVQIKELEEAGRPAWQAVVEATEHRMRPIMLTAAAASLGLLPIAREIFWGPMAYAMMGGIIVGTVLTLLFLPALYVAWFRIKEPDTASARSK